MRGTKWVELGQGSTLKQLHTRMFLTGHDGRNGLPLCNCGRACLVETDKKTNLLLLDARLDSDDIASIEQCEVEA